MDFFRFGLFLNSSATDIVLVTLPSTAVETAVTWYTSHCAMARGHCLNASIVSAAVHGLSSLFPVISAVEPSLSRPLPPLSPSLISNFASVDVKQHGQGHHMLFQGAACIWCVCGAAKTGAGCVRSPGTGSAKGLTGLDDGQATCFLFKCFLIFLFLMRKLKGI